MATSDDRVYFTVSDIDGKLRVRIINSKVYSPLVNCQFPRDIREEGAIFSADSSAITISHGSAGTTFYRVKPKSIRREYGAGAIPDSFRIFDSGDQLCSVCLDENKTTIFVPCGHFCTCSSCSKQLTTCPLCRTRVTARLLQSDL